MAEQSEMKIDVARLFEALNSLQKSLECTICLELMVEPMKTRCGHSFCQSCIRRVLQKKTAHCPLCKKSLNRRNVSKDDHLETYVDKFKRFVVAIQMDIHVDVLSYLKQPRDTKESCSYSDAGEFRDSNRRRSSKELSKSTRDLSLNSNRRIDAPSTSRGVPIDCDNPRQCNTNSLDKKSDDFSTLSGVHRLPGDENDDTICMPDIKCRTWLHTLPDDLPMNPSASAVNDAAEPSNTINTDDERESDGETRQSKTDKSHTRTRQVRKRSADYTAHIGGTSQVDKEAEARQLNKVGRIDSATSELKYNASHARIRANSAKRKRNAMKSDEQEIQENDNRRSSSLTMANDQIRQSSRSNVLDSSILDVTSTNNRQSPADTNWSRVIKVGKEMRPKRRKVKRLDVNIEKKKPPRIVEDVALSPHSKYTLIGDAANHNTNKKETSVSNLLEELKSRKQDAIDKVDLTNAKVSPETSIETDSEEQSFNIAQDNVANHSMVGTAYITLEAGRQVSIISLSNDQVSQIIGFDGDRRTSQYAENQRHEENANVTPKRRNDPSQRHRLTILTPEKLNQSVDECEISRAAAQTPSGKLESSLPTENHTPGPRLKNSAQKTSERISSEFQSPIPGRLSLKRKQIIDDHKNTDSSPLRQLPLSSDKSPISRREKGTSDRKSVGSPSTEDDASLTHRLTTVRRDLSSQISGEMPIKRNTVPSKETVEIENNNANVSIESRRTSLKRLKNIKNERCGFSVTFMQLGTMIRRRDVKYSYLATTKSEQSLPAEVRVTPVYNMQQTISRSEIEQHVAIKSQSLAPLPILQHSNDITITENIHFVGSDEKSATALKDIEHPSIYKVPNTSKLKKNINSHSDQKKIAANRAQSIEYSSTLTNRSNKSIQEKCQRFSPIRHKKPCVDNNADRISQKTSRTFSETTNSIKLLSPDKDSQLRFLAIDSPMNEHEQRATRRFELDKSVTKENNFSEAKSLRPTTSMPRTQELSSESSEFIFRKSNKKKKKTKHISDEEEFVDEPNDKSDNSNSSDNDQRTVKLDEYKSRLSKNAKLDMSRKHRLSTPQDQNEVVLDSMKQTHARKYKRIISFSNSDSESESSYNKRNQKRCKMNDGRMDDHYNQQNVSITNAPKEKRLLEQDTDENLRIQNIVNKWSNEHNATQQKLIRESSNTQEYPSEEKPTNHRPSRLTNPLESEKHDSTNQKISGTVESDMFESNSIFYAENMDYIMQQTIKSNRSQTSRITDPSNEDIINRVVQINRSASRSNEESQRKKNSGEHLLHDNFDEIIANVVLPQSENVMSQAKQSSRKMSNYLAITNEPCGTIQESPIMISSTSDDIFELRSNDFPRRSCAARPDKENVTSHDQKRLRDRTNDRRNRKDVEATVDLVDADDKGSRRKATSKQNASREKEEAPFDSVDANDRQIDKERNVSARSADRLHIDDSSTLKATAASDESKNNSFEDDTLMNVTQHQAQLQIFEEDLFGIPATRNGAKSTKVTSRADSPREEQDTPKKRTTQDKKTTLEEYSGEEDDVVENTPERKMKNSGNNVTAIKSRKNIARMYSSPIPNPPVDRTPSTSDILYKKDTPKSGASTPMSRLKMCPLYQSTPKVARAPATTIKRPDASTERKKIEPTASGSILSSKQVDSRTLETARRQPDQQKLCFVCSGLTVAQIKHVREFAERRNANYVNQFEPSVTHVIVNTIGKENVTKSTLKCLQGIAHRKWIVSYIWIEDCDREQKLLDELPYEATMHYEDVNGTGPRNSRLRSKGLFEDFTFLCYGPYVNVTQNQYQDLLLATGATVVDSFEALAKKGGLRGIVIQDNVHDDKLIEYWYRTTKAAPIIVDWIVECIGQYKLFKLAPYTQSFSLQDFCAIGYPRELVEDEEYSDDDT